MSTVFVIREFNRFTNKELGIYGVYSTHEKAVNSLIRNEPGVRFNDIDWTWKNSRLGTFYRIDEYTVDLD